MIDHIYLPVTDLERSETFYSAMLGPLGKFERWHFKAQAGYPDLAGFGEPGIPGFWLKASKTTCAGPQPRLAKKRCQKHRQDIFVLDTAFALIEGHPTYASA